MPLRRVLENPTLLVPARVRSYLHDVEDHLTTVTERVASYDELLTTLLNATIAKLSLQQNTDMRKITAWAAIIAVPTMIAAAYGMNFENMPGLALRLPRRHRLHAARVRVATPDVPQAEVALELEPVTHARLGNQVPGAGRLGLQLAAQLREVDP